MKKVFLLAVMTIVIFCANAQKAISFEKVFKADSVSKDVIFSKISEWIAASFISTDDDYYANRNDGVITKDYQFPYQYGSIMYKAYDGTIRCKIKVEVKDGRFKVTFFNFIHKLAEINKNHTLSQSKSYFDLVFRTPILYRKRMHRILS